MRAVPRRTLAIGAALLVGASVFAAFAAASPASASASASTTVKLAPGQTRSWRCVGNNACVRAMRFRDGTRLVQLAGLRIVAGCWSGDQFHESCTVRTDCRAGRCWAKNGSGQTVLVRR